MSVYLRGPVWWFDFQMKGVRWRGPCEDCKSKTRARQIEQHKRGDSPFVFPSPRSSDGHIGWFSQVWARTIERVRVVCKAKRLKLPAGLVLYSLRHTFATNYLRAGGDIGQLSRIMGHSDIRTTMRYVHLLAASDAAKIMDRVNATKLEIVRRRA